LSVLAAVVICGSPAARGQRAVPIAGAPRPDPMAALNAHVAAAERNLQIGERQLAESHFRSALLEGWMLTGAIAAADGRLTEARQAFTRAAAATASSRAAEQALAAVQLQLGDTDEALRILSRLAGMDPHDTAVRRLLAQGYVSSGRPEAAVQELEEAHADAPGDLETAFALAGGYARMKKIEAAERLFEQVAAKRPIPQTYVLIGRTYRDAGVYDRAVRALRQALTMDPRVRRAHYYLGGIALMSEGVVRLDEAIGEFQQERALAPGDALNNLRLGMALVVARREREALPLLEVVARTARPAPEAVEYLGRAQLAAGDAAQAVTTLRRALELAGPSADRARVGQIHYVLATALRQAGQAKEADAEFAEAQRLSAARATADRERLTRYMTDAGEAPGAGTLAAPLDAPALDGTSTAERAALTRQVGGTLARTCLNLGVLQAQGQRFARAAAFFEQAAAIDPAYPRVQYSLGVAYFNGNDYARAAPALQRAIDAEPQNAEARRMLAMASLNIGDYARAAELLASDPQRGSDPSIEYSYGLALVRSDRGAEAERVFSALLAAHGDTPELNVVLGQAHAQQGDFDAAIKVLRHAIEQKPGVADAHATLGIIYMKQGRLADSTRAFRDELAAHADDVKTRYTLATVLDLDGHQDEALTELRGVLRAKPDYADARYLHGKILLARGDAAGAAAALEIAVRLAPDEANIRYQLGQAYQKLGKTDQAQEQFQAYQRLKDQRRKESR
jgi:tetratricopeptide (TPR) repeat protein